MSKQKKKVVYSTKAGDLRKTSSSVGSYPRRSQPPTEQRLKIMRDKKGRRGKIVTVVAGFALTSDDLTGLAKTLKTSCGSGGTVKMEAGAQIIEIQGDHREKIAEKLKSLGYSVKLAGG